MSDETMLSKTVKVARNLMKIQISDRIKELDSFMDDLNREDNTLHKRVHEISESYCSDALAGNRAAYKFYLALQEYVHSIDPEDIDEDEFEAEFGNGSSSDFIITPSSVIDARIRRVGDEAPYSYTLHYTFKTGYISFIQPQSFTFDVGFSDEELKVIASKYDNRDRYDKARNEINELKKKLNNMDEVIMRVETEILISEIGNDTSALSTVQSLVDKYISGGKLPDVIAYKE